MIIIGRWKNPGYVLKTLIEEEDCFAHLAVKDAAAVQNKKVRWLKIKAYLI